MARPIGVGAEELRRANLSAILRTVHTDGATTRAVLTQRLGLNRSTIGGLTSELQSLGLVSEASALVAGRSGRPSHLVVPRDDNIVVAIDLGVDRIVAAVVGLGGAVLERRTRVHQRGEHDVGHVVESVAQMIGELMAGRPEARCLGVGAAVPGTVRSADGVVQFAPNLGWVTQPFSELLSKRVDLPVTAGNDGNLGVLAEHVRGAGMGFAQVAYLTGSVGIGGGFIANGRLLGGASGYAGEVGHLQVDASGPACRCGALGCWETKAGEDRLLNLAGRLSGGGPEAVAQVIASAAQGDERADAALVEIAQWIGVGIRAVVTMLNPDVIVLGGSLAQVYEAKVEIINAGVNPGALLSPRSDVIMASAALGADSALIGAAELAFAPILDDPQSLGGLGDLESAPL